VLKIICVILIFPLISVGQKLHKIYYAPADLDSIQYNISPKTFAPSEIGLPFSGIEIIDARFDTSKLGFEFHREYNSLHQKDFKRIKLEGGIQLALKDFYNEYYKPSFNNHSNNKLLLVLKTFLINNIPSADYPLNVRYNITRESYQNIYVKIEYYLKRDEQYFAMTRLDTVYQLTESNIHSPELKFKKNDLSFFTYVIKSAIEKYDFNALITKAENGKKLTISEIDSFNKKRFLLPALTDTAFKHGVFLTTKEFIDNSPSVTKYEFKKIKGNRYLYINGDFKKDHFYFATSDSQGLHFNLSKKNEVNRLGNTFEFFSFADIFLPKTMGGAFLDIGGSGANQDYVMAPRQLNMETGEIY
jgi:hypothetical protein